MLASPRRACGLVLELLLLSTTALFQCSAAPLSTPWATLELIAKDRAISRQPWATYESAFVLGVHSTTPPVSPQAALEPSNYQIAGSTGGSASVVEVSYKSRLLFLNLRATPNHPDPIAWGHHVFLRVSSPVAAGLYNITALPAVFGQDTTLQLAVDEDKTINENIHVNQVGYPLYAAKKAIIGAWMGSTTATAPFIHATLQLPNGDGSSFSVVNAGTGAVAYVGTAQLFGDGVIHQYFKQITYHLDFGTISTPGRYFIKVPGLGVSHTFTVSKDALKPALGALSRSFYGQRCGVALDKAFLDPWERPEPCHATDAQIMSIDPPPAWFTSKMPVPNQSNTTTLPPSPGSGSYFLPQPPGGTQLHVVGGHHDAGDYGKYVINSGSLVGWLMVALDILGADIDDLPLPEAGDGVPDIAQLVQHELKFLEGMQDSDGGVFCVVKPNTTAGEYYEHHVPCGTPGKDQCNFAPDSPVRGARTAWPKDTTCTAQFAAAMARVARSPWFKTFRPTDAARYLSKAIKAWDFLAQKAPYGALCYHGYGCGGAVSAAEANPPGWQHTYNCFDPQGDQSHDERVWAAVELYAATGQDKYHAYFLERHCPRYRHWGWVMLPFSYGLATVTYAQLAAQPDAGGNASVQVNATMAARCLSELAETGRGFAAQAAASPYFLVMPERSASVYGYGWQFPGSIAAQMLIAAQLVKGNDTETAVWRDMAARQLDYVMGINPQGYSLITGLGARRITNPVDDESVYDDLDAPWPGQIVGLAGGFSWLNQYGAAQGKSFPPGSDYALFDRIADGFNVATEATVPEMALALGALATVSGRNLAPLPPKPVLTVQQSVSSGPTPLNVTFQLSVSADPDSIATLEFDFGDGGHSYQAAPTHTYLEPGRVFQGFAIVVDTRGQSVTQRFTVTTSFPFNSTAVLSAPPSDLQLVVRVDHAAGSASSMPPLLTTAGPLVGGSNASLPISVTATLTAGMAAATDNLAWQGPQSSWSGAALRPTRFEDTAVYTIDTVSTPAMQTVLTAASGGLVLDAWLYVDAFLTYGRDNVPLLALVTKDGTLFGLQGTKWSGNQLVAGGAGVVANDTQLQGALTLGRWHFVRVSVQSGGGVNDTGVCSAWVDGALVGQKSCQASKVFNFCATVQSLKLVVGTFDGYADGIRVYASPQGDTSSLCGARPPPPLPSPSPAPPPPANFFSTYTVNAATIAVMNADSACGMSGSTVNSSLPLQLFSYGQPTGAALTPALTSYSVGLAVDGNNTRWAVNATGCSLRLASDAVTGGNALVKWQLPKALLQSAVYTNAFTLEAKIFVEVWRKGYSKWNSDVLGTVCNWDTFFKFTHDIWQGPALLLSTPAASTTGAFAGTLGNAGVVESALPPGAWHHVVLSANATSCVWSVDGAIITSGQCEAKSLLWQTNIDVVVGGFVGWVDELAISADARVSQAPNTTNYVIPPPPPLPPRPSPLPSPSPSPAPKPDNRFAPLILDAATIAVMDTESTCGLSGAAVGTSLPLVLYSKGQATGSVLVPSSATYTAGLAVSSNNTGWAPMPFGCSLRVASEAVSAGNAAVSWKLSQSLLQPAVAANAFTVEAKVFIEVWRKGYSKWNSDVLGSACNWDTFFKFTHDIWKGPSLLLSTPAASTTGAFGGTLANTTVVESVMAPGVWHHVALAANATTCVFSVDGAVIASGKCEAKKLIWQTATTVTVGGFVGYVDELAVSAASRGTQVPVKPERDAGFLT